MSATPTSSVDWLRDPHEDPRATLVAGPPGFEQYLLVLLADRAGEPADNAGTLEAIEPDTDLVTMRQVWQVLGSRTTTPDEYVVIFGAGGDRTSAASRANLRDWRGERPTFVWPQDRSWVTTLAPQGHYLTVSGTSAAIASLLRDERIGGATYAGSDRTARVDRSLRVRPRLTLASQSPARLATLRAAGVEPDVVVSGVDESGVTGAPADVARELATLKCRAVAADLPTDALVLGCDSVLELDGEVLGKPDDAADATVRWQRMRGRSGVLHTGHCLRHEGTEVVRGAATTVHFGDVSDAEIAAYVATGEPLHVAGAFTVDGLGGAFVTGIEGDHHNVVGLSLPLLRTMLAELGVAWTDLWTPR